MIWFSFLMKYDYKIFIVLEFFLKDVSYFENLMMTKKALKLKARNYFWLINLIFWLVSDLIDNQVHLVCWGDVSIMNRNFLWMASSLGSHKTTDITSKINVKYGKHKQINAWILFDRNIIKINYLKFWWKNSQTGIPSLPRIKTNSLKSLRETWLSMKVFNVKI